MFISLFSYSVRMSFVTSQRVSLHHRENFTPQHKRHRLGHVTVGKTTKQNIHHGEFVQWESNAAKRTVALCKSLCAFCNWNRNARLRLKDTVHQPKTQYSAYSTFHTAACMVFCGFTLSLSGAQKHRKQTSPYRVIPRANAERQR